MHHVTNKLAVSIITELHSVITVASAQCLKN